MSFISDFLDSSDVGINIDVDPNIRGGASICVGVRADGPFPTGGCSQQECCRSKNEEVAVSSVTSKTRRRVCCRGTAQGTSIRSGGIDEHRFLIMFVVHPKPVLRIFMSFRASAR